MKRKLLWGLLALLLLGSLTSCKKEEEKNKEEGKNKENPTEAAESNTVQGISDFGDRTYFFNTLTDVKSVSAQGIFEVSSGLLQYTSFVGNSAGQSIVLCSDLSCRHVHSDPNNNIPVTCEAEPPYGVGFVVYEDGDIYVISSTEYINDCGLYVQRRSIDGGGWELIAFLPGYLLDGVAVGYQFAENGKAYIVVEQEQEVEMAFGTLQNGCRGVMEITLATGEYRMIVPVNQDAYQNMYYMNLLGNTFVYCYVSASASLLEELKDADLDTVAKRLPEESSTKVVTVNMDTLEQTQFGEYSQKASLSQERKTAQSYFVDVYQDGVVYVEDRVTYLKCYEDGSVNQLFKVPEGYQVDAMRFSNALRLQLYHGNAGDYTIGAVYDVTKDGTAAPRESVTSLASISMCLDNGYSFVRFTDSNTGGNSVSLVRDEAVRNDQMPEEIPYFYNN